MLGVEVKDNESVDRAINRFKKLVARSRILNEYRDRQEYTKPSKQRREALKKSIREQKRRDRNQF
jgi:small subunit ribosomal protein S21